MGIKVEQAPPVAVATPANATSVAYETSRIIRRGPGTLKGVSGYSSKTSAQFILLFDAARVPVDGAIPVAVIAVQASSNFSIDYGIGGRGFTSGIIVVCSSTGPTLTIGSADCWFDAQHGPLVV